MGSPCDHAGKGSWRWALRTLRVVNSPSPQSKIGRHTVNIFSVASACSRHAFTKKASVLFCLLSLSSWILGCAVLLVFARVEATFDACSGLRQLVLRAAKMLPILLGLLAKIKCSICSYQFNIWYTGNAQYSILNEFFWGATTELCLHSGSKDGHGQAQRRGRPPLSLHSAQFVEE